MFGRLVKGNGNGREGIIEGGVEEVVTKKRVEGRGGMDSKGQKGRKDTKRKVGK